MGWDEVRDSLVLACVYMAVFELCTSARRIDLHAEDIELIYLNKPGRDAAVLAASSPRR